MRARILFILLSMYSQCKEQCLKSARIWMKFFKWIDVPHRNSHFCKEIQGSYHKKNRVMRQEKRVAVLKEVELVTTRAS